MVLLSGGVNPKVANTCVDARLSVFAAASVDDGDAVARMHWILGWSRNTANKFAEYKAAGHGTDMFAVEKGLTRDPRLVRCPAANRPGRRSRRRRRRPRRPCRRVLDRPQRAGRRGPRAADLREAKKNRPEVCFSLKASEPVRLLAASGRQHQRCDRRVPDERRRVSEVGQRLRQPCRTPTSRPAIATTRCGRREGDGGAADERHTPPEQSSSSMRESAEKKIAELKKR